MKRILYILLLATSAYARPSINPLDISPANVDSNEFGYLNGLTSNVQGQIDVLCVSTQALQAQIGSGLNPTESITFTQTNTFEQAVDFVNGLEGAGIALGSGFTPWSSSYWQFSKEIDDTLWVTGPSGPFLFLQTNSYMGVAVASPTNTLDVGGPATVRGALYTSGNIKSAGTAYFSGQATALRYLAYGSWNDSLMLLYGYNVTNGTKLAFGVYLSATGDGYASVCDSNGTARVQLNSRYDQPSYWYTMGQSHKIGINTNVPQYALDVVGTIGVSSDLIVAGTSLTNRLAVLEAGAPNAVKRTGDYMTGDLIMTNGAQYAMVPSGLEETSFVQRGTNNAIVARIHGTILNSGRMSVGTESSMDSVYMSADEGFVENGTNLHQAIVANMSLITGLNTTTLARVDSPNTFTATNTVAADLQLAAGAKLGIGITPTNALHVSGNSTFVGDLKITGDIQAATATFSDISIDSASASGGFWAYNALDAAPYVAYDDPAGSYIAYQMYVDANGYAQLQLGQSNAMSVVLESDWSADSYWYTAGHTHRVGINTNIPGEALVVNGNVTCTSNVTARAYKKTLYGLMSAATVTLDSANGESQYLDATNDVTLVVTPKATTMEDGITLSIRATGLVTVQGLDSLVYTNQVLVFSPTTNWSSLIFYSPYGSSNYYLRQLQPALP